MLHFLEKYERGNDLEKMLIIAVNFGYFISNCIIYHHSQMIFLSDSHSYEKVAEQGE